MTDSDIIKALERCTTNGASCKDCPAFVKVDRSNCKKVLLGALDIINRLQARVDDLERDELPRCKYALKRANEMGIELQAENERLKVENQSLRGAANSLKMHYEKVLERSKGNAKEKE